jgi:DNA-binding NarL/FixJ family response regulator
MSAELLSKVTVFSIPQQVNNRGVCVLVLVGSKEVSVSRIRVVLADDHQSVIARVRAVLGEEFEVIDTAENGDQAVNSVLLLDADVLVIDISMPVLNGFQAATRLQRTNSRAKVIFLTIHEDPDFVTAAFAAGASGYVIKSRLNTDLIPAIREALLGNTFVSQHLKI